MSHISLRCNDDCKHVVFTPEGAYLKYWKLIMIILVFMI